MNKPLQSKELALQALDLYRRFEFQNLTHFVAQLGTSKETNEEYKTLWDSVDGKDPARILSDALFLSMPVEASAGEVSINYTELRGIERIYTPRIDRFTRDLIFSIDTAIRQNPSDEITDDIVELYVLQQDLIDHLIEMPERDLTPEANILSDAKQNLLDSTQPKVGDYLFGKINDVALISTFARIHGFFDMLNGDYTGTDSTLEDTKQLFQNRDSWRNPHLVNDMKRAYQDIEIGRTPETAYDSEGYASIANLLERDSKVLSSKFISNTARRFFSPIMHVDTPGYSTIVRPVAADSSDFRSGYQTDDYQIRTTFEFDDLENRKDGSLNITLEGMTSLVKYNGEVINRMAHVMSGFGRKEQSDLTISDIRDGDKISFEKNGEMVDCTIRFPKEIYHETLGYMKPVEV